MDDQCDLERRELVIFTSRQSDSRSHTTQRYAWPAVSQLCRGLKALLADCVSMYGDVATSARLAPQLIRSRQNSPGTLMIMAVLDELETQ